MTPNLSLIYTFSHILAFQNVFGIQDCVKTDDLLAILVATHFTKI